MGNIGRGRTPAREKRRDESRAREARVWADKKRARTLELRATGATYTHGKEPTHAELRANGQPTDHDLSRGMAPHGTHKQSPISGREAALIRAWDEDRVRWHDDGITRMKRVKTVDVDGKPTPVILAHATGRTVIMPRAKKSEDTGESYSISHAGRTAPAARRVDNTPGRSIGWHDDNEKAERAFARELRIERAGG